MILGLLERMEVPASDDDEEATDYAFVFRNREGQSDEPACEHVRSLTPEDVGVLVICNGAAASAFAETAFDFQAVPWTVQLDPDSDVPTFPLPPRPPRVCVLAESRAAFVMVKEPVPGNMAYAWAQALLDGFQGVSEVLLLDTIFRTEFLVQPGQEPPLEPHLSGLWSAAWDKAGLAGAGAVAPLPTPNTVVGVGGALLTQCEADAKGCLVAFSLQDGAHVAGGSLCAFEGLGPVFVQLGIPWKAPESYHKATSKMPLKQSMSIYA